jgi:DNA helicase-2/ATP-dependent DNA helicase PcrA
MLDFVNTYPDTKFVVLKNNYRSAQSILDYSTNLIENNSQRLVNKLPNLKKELIAQNPPNPLFKGGIDENKYFILEDEILEKLFVLEDIKRKNNKEDTFAIICRSNKEVESWTKFIQLQNMEVESKLKTNILKNKFVSFILDFLGLIENPDFSDEKLLDILRTDIIDIENIDVISLSKELYKKNYSKN